MDLTKQGEARPPSADLAHEVLSRINSKLKLNQVTPDMPSYARMAMALNPYAPQVDTIFEIHNKSLAALTQSKHPDLHRIIQSCVEKKIPLPLILSCEKFLPKALELQAAFKARYFSITPVIVKGDLTLTEASFDPQRAILTLPVADTYEALPVKVFETCSFFYANGATSGLIKIDDDLALVPIEPLALHKIACFFETTDYVGLAIMSSFHNRLWHAGKCKDPVPSIYGKPVKGPWCRGALYFLSNSSLKHLSKHYFRFPGCLDGEMYEDKAVGDVLNDNGIFPTPLALETLLGFDTAVSPERLVNLETSSNRS